MAKKIDKIRMIVSDIDGTMSDTNMLSDYTKEVLNKVHEKGILFGIASGRPYYAIRRSIGLWELKYQPDIIIGMNGAQLYDTKTNELTEQNVLSVEAMKEIYDFMEPYRDKTNLFIYGDNCTIFEKNDEIFIQGFIKYKEVEKCYVAEELKDMFKESTPKMLFRLYDENDMPGLEKYIAEHPNPHFTGFKTQTNLMEFVDPRVNKYVAVHQYALKHDISEEAIAGFGDMSNDYELIRDSGIGVCLLNGSDDCKSVADYVTEKDCSHDGFADFIDRYILSE